MARPCMRFELPLQVDQGHGGQDEEDGKDGADTGQDFILTLAATVNLLTSIAATTGQRSAETGILAIHGQHHADQAYCKQDV